MISGCSGFLRGHSSQRSLKSVYILPINNHLNIRKKMTQQSLFPMSPKQPIYPEVYNQYYHYPAASYDVLNSFTNSSFNGQLTWLPYHISDLLIKTKSEKMIGNTGKQTMCHLMTPKSKCKTIQKAIVSAKKNSESNIVNQFYAYFSYREQSQGLVRRAISSLSGKKTPTEQQQILEVFYRMFHNINTKRGRKYVNHRTLFNFFCVDFMLEQIPEVKGYMDPLKSFFAFEQLCEVFRRCCYGFFKSNSLPAILTSKRISSVSKQEHCSKIRKVLKLIVNN